MGYAYQFPGFPKKASRPVVTATIKFSKDYAKNLLAPILWQVVTKQTQSLVNYFIFIKQNQPSFIQQKRTHGILPMLGFHKITDVF